MIYNPFIVSGKIERKYFCDRKIESRELTDRLLNGQNIVLISRRRMGKTGLIDFCYEGERIKNDFYTFFIDILQTNTFGEFIFLFWKAIYAQLVPRSKKLAANFVLALKSLAAKLTYDPITGIPSLNLQIGDITNPEVTLEEIFDYLSKADKHCIVAIDEFQQISNYPEKNIEAILRTHIQKSSNCNFIFSGSQRHILQEMFMSHAHPFFNSATFMHLGPIPESDYVEYIQRLFSERSKSISIDISRHIYQKFEGHTYYVQRTCNECFLNTPAGEECDANTLEISLDKILNMNGDVYREVLSQLPVKQKELLYAIALEVNAKAITSSDFIKKYSLSSASSVQSAAKMLLHRELVTREENTYSISDRFFQLWIKRMFNS